MSEGVSEWASEWVSEWAQRSARAKQIVQSKQTSERGECMSERTSERPSTPICILDYSGPQLIRVSEEEQIGKKKRGFIQVLTKAHYGLKLTIGWNRLRSTRSCRGQKPPFPRAREWESEQANKRLRAAERASEASRAEPANGWALRANKWTDERVAQFLRLNYWLSWTIKRGGGGGGIWERGDSERCGWKMGKEDGMD